MLYRIIVITGPLKGQQFTVEKEPMTLGRDAECTVSVEDQEMARKHAVLEHSEAGLFIRDLGTMNKILVNKHEVREARLKHGDLIELGRTRFLVQASVEAEVAGGRPEARGPGVRFAAGAVAIVLAVAATAGLYVWLLGGDTEETGEELGEVAEPMVLPEPVAAPPAPPAVPVAPPDDGSKRMSEEFQRMHQDLADIRESMKDLATRKPEPAPAPAAPAAPAPDAEAKAAALRLKAEAMLARAQKENAAGNLLEADQLLDGIQILDPAYLPAYEERAKVCERRGLLEPAREQWQEVMKRSPGTPLYERAVAERIRLGQAAREAKQVAIAAVEAVKLQSTDEYDERRIVNVTLAPSSPDKMLDVQSVRIEVLFFDADRKSGKILRTRALVPQEPLRLEGRWAAGEHRSAEATYLVPKGFRAREAKEGRDAQFYGYLVRVYYHDQLQAQEARPKTLLDARPAAK